MTEEKIFSHMELRFAKNGAGSYVNGYSRSDTCMALRPGITKIRAVHDYKINALP